MQFQGHHHVSMVVKNAKATDDFYRRVLGLRRVKKTVNQDSPSMYHLFYGDTTGTPGTELTFFEIPMVGRTHKGTDAITKIALVVPNVEALAYWQQRFEQFDVRHDAQTTYADKPALPFYDPDGLGLVLVADEAFTPPSAWSYWAKSPVPQSFGIQGFVTTELTVADLAEMERILTELFGYNVIARDDNSMRVRGAGGLESELLVVKQDGAVERPGRGSIHHIALRVADEDELQAWHDKIVQFGLVSSGVVDRYYFKSLYVKLVGHIIFELATDGPGFLRDGNIETLGQALDLPAFLEPHRADIEADLHPIDEEEV
ncbi:MAG: VOC family protein [Caryophanon sp.]|nr:VOC family protein [Caryophanon sp.]